MKYFILLVSLFCIGGCVSDPKPGDVWLYEHVSEEKNPFDPNFGRQRLSQTEDSVLDVKDGWVKYCIVGGTNVFYMTIHEFEIDEHKIR